MTAPVTVRGRDLRALAGIVSKDRPDLPDGEGLPPSLLADLMGQIRCDGICFMGFDSGRHRTWVLQAMPALEKDDLETGTDLDLAHWAHYWDSQPCSYPDRTGDVRSHRGQRSRGRLPVRSWLTDPDHQGPIVLSAHAGTADPGRTRTAIRTPPVCAPRAG